MFFTILIKDGFIASQNHSDSDKQHGKRRKKRHEK